MMRPLRAHTTSTRRLLWRHRRSIRTVVLASIFLFGLRELILVLLRTETRRTQSQTTKYDVTEYEPLNITGFVNDGRPGQRSCDELRRDDKLSVQKSWFLEDDLLHIARLMNGHPMIDYSTQDQSLTFEEMVSQTWTRLSGSSVWLEKHQVFLTVTRVIFYAEGEKSWPIISLLRGQVYNSDWKELKDHTLTWKGRGIVFPTIFPISYPYMEKHRFFGPEDPRVLIEDGIDDPEPIIVFNMIYDTQTWTRAMHVFRPFTDILTILTIKRDAERAEVEKNWAPFFFDDSETIAQAAEKTPSEYLHFIYRFNPLVIFKCKLTDGFCDVVYEQDTESYALGSHDDDDGRMTGGTNLVPLPMKSKLGANLFLGFPRSHVEVGCNGKSIYRPALMVLSAHQKSFHIDYMSDSIDFGSAAMSEEAFIDPCHEGQILIANSIAQWDRSHGEDIMTVSFSVGDSTVQVLRLRGMLAFIKRLYLAHESPIDLTGQSQVGEFNRWSDAANHVLGCSIEAAANHSTALYVNGFYRMQEAMARGY